MKSLKNSIFVSTKYIHVILHFDNFFPIYFIFLITSLVPKVSIIMVIDINYNFLYFQPLKFSLEP